MTRAEKLAVHLEAVIWEDLPNGTILNAAEIGQLMATATDAEKLRAYRRALVRSPLLLDDELGWG